MIYIVEAYFEPADSYGLRKLLKANGFNIRRFNPRSFRTEDYKEDYSSDEELVKPDLYRKDLFYAIYSGHNSFPSQEVFKELLNNRKVVNFTIRLEARI